MIIALYRSGRQGDAVGAFDRARRVLVEHLGIEPGRELRDLQVKVLAQDPDLDLRAPAITLPDGLAAPPHAMVGRTTEMAALREVWAAARSGAAPVLAVCGFRKARAGPGLGRARASRAAEAGAVVAIAVARCRLPPGLWGDRFQPRLLTNAQPGWCWPWRGPTRPPAPPGAVGMRLRPLDRAGGTWPVVCGYADPTEVDHAVGAVQRVSGGWPGPLHRAAAEWVHRAAEARVSVASDSAARSADALTRARAELAGGVLALRDDSDRAQVPPGHSPWKRLAAYEMADAPWFSVGTAGRRTGRQVGRRPAARCGRTVG